MVSNAASGSGLQSSTPELKLSNMEFPGFFSIRMLTFQSRSHPEVKACQKSMSSPRHLAQLPHTLLECSWIQALIPRMIGGAWYVPWKTSYNFSVCFFTFCWRSSRINETVVTMIKAKLMYENAIASRLELGSFSTWLARPLWRYDSPLKRLKNGQQNITKWSKLHGVADSKINPDGPQN